MVISYNLKINGNCFNYHRFLSANPQKILVKQTTYHLPGHGQSSALEVTTMAIKERSENKTLSETKILI